MNRSNETSAARCSEDWARWHLARREYRESALIACCAQDYWEDSAYIAERVLTVDELKDYGVMLRGRLPPADTNIVTRPVLRCTVAPC